MKPTSARHPLPFECPAILLIDDEPLVITAARRALERSGFEVLSAVGGREGVQQFVGNRERIAAVLLDVNMPELSGPDTYAELQRHGLDVPVVLTSGYGEEIAEADFPEGLIAGFVPKPYRPRELVNCLQQLLE